VRNGGVERCTVAAFPAALRASHRPRAKTDRIIAVSNRALPAGHMVRPSIIPKCRWLHDRSIQRDDAAMPDRPTKITLGEMADEKRRDTAARRRPTQIKPVATYPFLAVAFSTV
jgi:hypothetical protein